MSKTHQSVLRNAPIRSIPPLSALIAFQSAAIHLSFRRAARELALSPSAISHQIRGLEDRLGVRLFARSSRAIRLTAEGKEYLKTVSVALGHLEDASRAMLRRSRNARTELRISSLPFFTSTVLIPALGEFYRQHPELTLHIDATHSYADFDSRGVDAAIRYGKEKASGLKFEQLLKVSGIPVCSPSLVKAKLRQPADLLGAPLIHMSIQPNAWHAWFNEAGIAGQPTGNELWFDNVPAALEAAERGLGVALGMHPLIKSYKGFGKTLVAPFPPSANQKGTLFLVTRPEQSSDKHIAILRRWLVAAVKTATS